jgi:uncharacterized membrane protein
MSIFHDMAAMMNNVNQPVTVVGTHLNYFFIAVKIFISVCGAFIILVGAAIGIYRYIVYRCTHASTQANLNDIRLDLARTIILGLEFFIASDVIETTITPDFQALGILAVLVIIRTILNFSLHKEIKDLSNMDVPETSIIPEK